MKALRFIRGMELVDSDLGGTIPLEILLFAKNKNTAAEFSDDEFSDDDFAEDEFAGDEFAEDEFGGDEFGAVADSQQSVDSRWFTVAGLNEIERIHDHIDSLSETGKVLSVGNGLQGRQGFARQWYR